MLFPKFHKITTLIAMYAWIIFTASMFLMILDQEYRFGADFLPHSWQPFYSIFTWALGLVAFGSSMISIVTGIFRIAEKE